MKILVTGGCGFIGANLIPMLIDQNHSVRVLDNLEIGSLDYMKLYPIDMIVGDVRDEQIVQKAVLGMDAVIHLAAHTSVIDSIHFAELDFEVNTRGTFNLLAASNSHGVKKFIFASSNSTIGETIPPINETKAPRPMSPYGASKLAGEGYCIAYFHSFGLKTVVLRFSNVYGPKSNHKGSVVAQFMRDIIENKSIKIYGDGLQTRDFIYVGDLCMAIIKSLKFPIGGETFQIATGIETSIIDLAKMLQRYFDRSPVQISFDSPRIGEILKNYSNINKANQLLHWYPQISLADGLPKTINWFLRPK